MDEVSATHLNSFVEVIHYLFLEIQQHEICFYYLCTCFIYSGGKGNSKNFPTLCFHLTVIIYTLLTVIQVLYFLLHIIYDSLYKQCFFHILWISSSWILALYSQPLYSLHISSIFCAFPSFMFFNHRT